MKITSQRLKELTKSPDYHALPFSLAGAGEADSTWCQTLEQVGEEAARMMIWQSTQHIAVLFDTYGSAIESVRMNVDTTQDKDDVYFDIAVYINDEHCFDGCMDLSEEALKITEQTDNSEALDLAVSELNDIGSPHLLGHSGLLSEALDHTFLSAEDARAIGQKYAPKVDAWARQQLLAELVVPEERNSRAGKHKM